MTTVRVSQVTDFVALGKQWRELERRAVCSFFQTWTWTGCLAVERFGDPVLVTATEGERTVALALFNRVSRGVGLSRLFLGESGDAALDCPYIEANGVLTEAGREDGLTEACVRAVAATHVLVVSGIGSEVLAAVQRATGLVWISKRNSAPFVDLAALRRAGGDYLAARSANARQQIRRSDRSYAARGELVARRAETAEAAHGLLDNLARLHQASWRARGQPGSFASPFFARFHHALIDAAFPRDQVVLMAVCCDQSIVGVLYNFSYGGRMLAYQSGFDYGAAGARGKPGMTCHHAAIRDALDRGFDTYDFLAGADRYKLSLADASIPIYWIEAGPAWSPRLLLHRFRCYLGR